jgi:hypothetical protein
MSGSKCRRSPGAISRKPGLFTGAAVIIGLLIFQGCGWGAERKALQERINSLENELQDSKQKAQELQVKLEGKDKDLSEQQTKLTQCGLRADSLQGEADSYGKERDEQRAQVWELQTRLMLSSAERKKINPQLQALWPEIEHKAPELIRAYRTALGGFGPDGFISTETEPKRLEVPEGTNPYGGFVSSFESYEWMFKDCVWSPDKTRCVWTCVDDCDVDSNVMYLDLKAKLAWQLTPTYGPSMSFRYLAWLDNDTFMFVLSDLATQVTPTICIYKATPEILVAPIGKHIGPAVANDKLHPGQ